MSAHSHKRFKQACKSCKRYFYAQYYWKNEYKVKKDIEQDKKALQDNLKHHMSDLC